MIEYAFEGVRQASSTITWSFASQTLATDIALPFSDPIAAAYRATVQQAFDRWQSVSGVSFTQVADAPTVAIRVGFGTFRNDGTVGQTYLRSNGKGILTNDTVIRLLDPAADPLTLVGDVWTWTDFDVTLLQVATHEIGHALGLDHSTDPVTMMYPIATGQNRALATGDIEGANALYPLYTVRSSQPIQAEGDSGATSYGFTITRYGDPGAPLQLDYATVGQSRPDLPNSVAATGADFVGGTFPTGLVTFGQGASTATLTIAVAGNTTPQQDRGFSLVLTAADGSALTERGDAGAAILDDDGNMGANGTIGVYRFFSAQGGTHFLTVSPQERNQLIQTRPDLIYEGAVLAARPQSSSSPDAVAIYRFFDGVHGTHFYTDSLIERDSVVASRSDLSFEGVAFYEDGADRGGDVPVYRFFDRGDGTHFYTSSDGERATILATRPDLLDEGISFYAPGAT